MKPKVAVIVQRYGAEVLGGSEEHCRKMVNLFRDNYDFTVLTTTAKEYITWADYYAPGDDTLDGIPVKRFEVKQERNIEEFNSFSEQFFATPPDQRNNEREWLDLQGPYCPTLLKYLEENRDKYDGFIFFTYLYYNTVLGLPVIGDKSILVSTAHDEPPIYLDHFRKLFESAGSIIFNTVTEREMVYRIHPNAQKKNVIGGYYIDKPDLDKLTKRPIPDKYLLYFGRLERGKGIFDLFDNFMLLNSYFPDLKLVCLGKKGKEIHPRHNIIFPGFVSEKRKWEFINHCEFVVMPSPHESLSITLLEGLTAGKPVIVNGECDVLVHHVRKGNAGFYYYNSEEFLNASRILLQSKSIMKKLKKNALKYVDSYYSKKSMFDAYHEGIKIVVGK
jgi:glycosyltransferase involved in cell wall biosynthesis